MGKYKTPDQLRESIKQNRSRLENCSKHVFIKNEDIHTYIPRYTCQNCGGSVGQAEKDYYEIGLKHGSKEAILRQVYSK
ncbi:hypothetical protein [Cellulosilyticum sp. I15G10I2]|uniref:hypothetical protein n=1 Tax=Cellulosilyticum sp. I15G10I2 TaxID=1892843 RepID=UPI00085C82F0|nr:hypothetical protein [Cellulosilyticum sp. I15G10I2]